MYEKQKVRSVRTEVHVEKAVWVDGGFVRRRGVIRVLDVWVLVGCIWRRRLLEVKSASFSIIRQMQGSEAGAKGIWAVIKAGNSSSKVKVMHWANKDRHRGLDHKKNPTERQIVCDLHFVKNSSFYKVISTCSSLITR